MNQLPHFLTQPIDWYDGQRINSWIGKWLAILLGPVD